MHLVLGLGNPGRRYVHTRHNAGFLVVDRLAERRGVACERRQLGALVETVRIGTETVVLAKPQTFMNLSGQAAASLSGFYKPGGEQLVVVHDDVDLPFGQIRVKKGGGHGGHNGLRDLGARLREPFLRVRLGVGRPPAGWDTADHVLGRWSADEEAALPGLVEEAADAVELVVTQGVVAAMNQVNVRRSRSAATPEASSKIQN
ncbi:MAG TPA: aminoacyl-tRNA hydrolase [Deltaproteobacteria bacterium]|nr:aminoacyl-tRNA hydrolase [Deltaproteobacteria bacterium]